MPKQTSSRSNSSSKSKENPNKNKPFSNQMTSTNSGGPTSTNRSSSRSKSSSGNGSTRCGNLRIFLSHRFYVKSILVILKPQKLPFWPFVQLQIVNFWEILIFLRIKIVKTKVFDPLKSAQIEFTENQSSRKIAKLWNIQHNSQLGCPGLWLRQISSKNARLLAQPTINQIT